MKIEYNNLYTHFVFITQKRIPMIKSQFRERIEKYITGIVNNLDCKMYAFSVSKGDVDKVCKYILNQPEHHRKKTFEEEYNDFIRYYQKTLNPSIR